MEFKDYLKIMVMKDASDLYLTTGAPPCAKFHGVIKPLEKSSLPAGRIREIAYSVMDAEQITAFEKKPEMNLALSESGVGRFRVNIFKQRNQVGMVVRNIKTDIPDSASLGLPELLKDIIMGKRGLVLFVGATGSGKSTSLASLIDHRNSHSTGHIITIEDPIEFVHQHKKSLVNQREVGVDTDCYADALKNTLRQAPDVILIGEIRDRETMDHAIAFAETGHLAISTLHANNANQALDRIINFFPEDRRAQLLLDLSLNLRAFVSQRLIPSVDGKRAAAFEILLGTPLVCDMIKRGEVAELKDVMEKSENLGMRTFDMDLYRLCREGQITEEEALRNADSANNLRLKIQLGQKAAMANQEYPSEEESPDNSSLSLVPDEADDSASFVRPASAPKR
ncbi:MAG: PilT/PilU family type 4a pilus ATPase [Gammaproteobacteria bacterium]|nr:PilT/PilU family type 4a pilus ATPase [Gammaproteobacteria bacterium]NIR98363.1 PilT/PilU family type 4a pilus ATPase [Gammaproteobacteria bacterium]NIT64900.1 PilT/PilU family type 4a pilus ATPase [Gammaproteobacteria bacterium]NIV21054.1 PilT/PilU family type 4a pilus ATPase [Gammaproteobacteria bacterium]NIY33480.1 PilT/PilU family type 4a pilus ATPase [Gammaproteobacteria bacterium]